MDIELLLPACANRRAHDCWGYRVAARKKLRLAEGIPGACEAVVSVRRWLAGLGYREGMMDDKLVGAEEPNCAWLTLDDRAMYE